MVHILLRPGLENFEHYFPSVWDECNFAIVWTFFDIAFFGIGVKTDLFQSCGHCWVFQICWHIECSTLTAASFKIWNGPQPCLTQWNYEPCCVGPLKTDRLWWRVLTKCGPLEKGMANHFSILALRTPWTVWKNGILFGHKKECLWVSTTEVYEPRVYYTKWSKSEREWQILYINTYIWNRVRWASLVAQTVKKSSAMGETWVQSLGWENPLQEGVATHSSILAWRVGLQSMGLQRFRHNWAAKHSTERWYWWTYLQGSNGDTESRLVDMVGKGKVGQMERVAQKHIHCHM